MKAVLVFFISSLIANTFSDTACTGEIRTISECTESLWHRTDRLTSTKKPGGYYLLEDNNLGYIFRCPGDREWCAGRYWYFDCKKAYANGVAHNDGCIIAR